MNNYELKIKAISEISFSTRMMIIAEYCKLYQEVHKEHNKFSGFYDDSYTVKEHAKNPVKIELYGHWMTYWVKCHKTKTSYVFDIWYAG
jgi:hypothetical protein